MSYDKTVKNMGVNHWTVPSLQVGRRDDPQLRRAGRGQRDHSIPGAEVPSGPCPPSDSGRPHAVNLGRSFVLARTGEPVARLKPMPETDGTEALRWCRDVRGPAGPFGAVFDLDDALDFIVSEPPFWIHA